VGQPLLLVVSVQMAWRRASIDTKIKWRDKHLRGRDFFDVGQYPTFTFSASDATALPDGRVGIRGALQIKDRSQPIELVATLTTPSAARIALHGELTIDRRQWGVSRSPMGAGLTNRVVVAAEYVRL
jgi:polyisoprenoid-binding protein YceI